MSKIISGYAILSCLHVVDHVDINTEEIMTRLYCKQCDVFKEYITVPKKDQYYAKCSECTFTAHHWNIKETTERAKRHVHRKFHTVCIFTESTKQKITSYGLSKPDNISPLF